MNLPEGGDGTCRGPGTELCILGWSSGVWKEVVESQLGREGGAECNGLKWTYSPQANLGTEQGQVVHVLEEPLEV